MKNDAVGEKLEEMTSGFQRPLLAFSSERCFETLACILREVFSSDYTSRKLRLDLKDPHQHFCLKNSFHPNVPLLIKVERGGGDERGSQSMPGIAVGEVLRRFPLSNARPFFRYLVKAEERRPQNFRIACASPLRKEDSTCVFHPTEKCDFLTDHFAIRLADPPVQHRRGERPAGGNEPFGPPDIRRTISELAMKQAAGPDVSPADFSRGLPPRIKRSRPDL